MTAEESLSASLGCAKDFAHLLNIYRGQPNSPQLPYKEPIHFSGFGIYGQKDYHES